MNYQINPMTDHSNAPVPPKATSLYPVTLPSTGGDTQFVSMHQANGDYDMNEVRRLHRIMIKGTRIAGEPVAEAERHAVPAQRVPASLGS